MRTSTAYFVGAGTVVAAIVVGLGGGLMMANIVSPHSPKYGTEMTRLEQRMSTRPTPVIAAPSEPVPHLAATQAAATNPVVVAPAQAQPQTETAANAAPAQPAEAANAAPAQPAEAATTRDTAPPSSTAPAAQTAARDSDMKRATTEKRRAERRQQWAERRRHLQRDDRDLRDVEQKVREKTEPPQAFAAEPVKLDMPRIRLFDAE